MILESSLSEIQKSILGGKGVPNLDGLRRRHLCTRYGRACLSVTVSQRRTNLVRTRRSLRLTLTVLSQCCLLSVVFVLPIFPTVAITLSSQPAVEKKTMYGALTSWTAGPHECRQASQRARGLALHGFPYQAIRPFAREVARASFALPCAAASEGPKNFVQVTLNL